MENLHLMYLNLYDVPAKIVCDDLSLFNELSKELSHFQVTKFEKSPDEIMIFFQSELSTKQNLKLKIDQIKRSKAMGRIMLTEEIVNYTNLANFESYFLAKKKWKLQEAVILVLNQLGFLLRLKLSVIHQLAVFHGASLAYNNQGILLLGQSGAGKTSLSFQCVRNGFQYFSDEDSFLIYKPEVKDFILLGFQRRLRLCDEIMTLLGVKNFNKNIFKSFGDQGIVYDPREEFPDVYGKNVNLLGIVILNNHHSNQSITVDEIPSSQGLTHLLNYFETASNMYGASEKIIALYNRNGFELVSALTEHYQIYQINYNFYKHFATLPFFLKKVLLIDNSN